MPGCRHYDVEDIILCEWIPALGQELIGRMCVECRTPLPKNFSPPSRPIPRQPGESVFGSVTGFWSQENAERLLSEEEIAELKKHFLASLGTGKPMILPPQVGLRFLREEWQRLQEEQLAKETQERIQQGIDDFVRLCRTDPGLANRIFIIGELGTTS